MPVGENSKLYYDNCFVSYNLPINNEPIKKKEREKVWEMARKIVVSPDIGGMEYSEIEDCFGTRSTSSVLRMPVDEALEKYESWKKKNSVEELIKNLKPQDVVCIKAHCSENFVGMVTRVSLNASELNLDILHTNGAVDTIIFPEDVEHIEKIGRVVEASDILGEIKKIEDEGRKNKCGS